MAQEEVKINGWLVRDKDDYAAIYSEKPVRGKSDWVDAARARNSQESTCIFSLTAYMFPEVTFESEPLEVEVTIKRRDFDYRKNGKECLVI